MNNPYRKRRSRRANLRLAVAGPALAGAGLLHCGVASAQEYDSAADQARADTLSFMAGLGIVRDSNVVRLPSGQNPGLNGAESRSDTILRGEFGAKYNRMISQQRLTLDALVEGYKYSKNGNFDNIGYDAGGNLDYSIGRALFGRVGLRVARFEPMIQDARTGQTDRNRIESQFLYWQGGVRLTTDWALIAGLDFDRRRNSVEVYKQQDLDRTSYELGTRYMRGDSTSFDLVWRHTKGEYQNEVTPLSFGVPQLGGPISLNYKQDSLLLRTEYRPSEETRVGGQIGWTRRNNDAYQIKDFKGLTFGGNIDWALSGITSMHIALSRGVEPIEYSTIGGYAESTAISLRPTIRATGRITVNPFYSFRNLKYQGYLGGLQDRKDRLHTFGIAADYDIYRKVTLWGDIRQERRNSSEENYDFKANIFSLGVRVRF